jgi:penicillin-binding protein 1C
MNIQFEQIIRSKSYKIITGIFLLLVLSFFTLDTLYPVDTNIDYSKVVKSSEDIVLSSFLSNDEKWRFYTKINDNSEFLKESIIFKEDRYFYYHLGVNPYSIIRSLIRNIISGKIISGGSTITMQTARLLEPKSRTYSNKIIEIFRAMQLEFHFSKDEILEIYLNKIPFGGNIEGTGAASVLYFGKNPDKLSLSESAILSVIPNNPNILNIGLKSSKIKDKKNKLLTKLFKSDIIDKEIYLDAVKESVNPKRLDAPKVAPHLSRRAIMENPAENVISTSINYTLQSRAEELVYNHIQSWQNYGVNNGSAIIIDNKSNNIIAYIGSNDFNDKRNAGEVDGVSSIRSPGSTLKPLLYGLLTDNGMITPKLSLLDVPILDPDYAPGNFDGEYRGRVTVEYALSQSLNIPAVNLLNKYGYKNFIYQLSKMNFYTLNSRKKDLGLSLILGGCGVTLEELAGMYTIFANKGQFRKPVYITNKQNKAIPIISESAAYIISDILTKLQRPDLPQQYFSAKGIPIIAWKTGTSQGRRDGWAIGYNRSFTIGVWVGNFSGKPNSSISGANVAVPLLFDLFHSISTDEKSNWLIKPDGLETRMVDADTGLLPSEFSKNVISDYYIPGVSISKVTEHLKQVWVSEDEKISYCSDCLPATGYKSKIYEFPELELQIYYKSNKINYSEVPPHNPKCTSSNFGVPPVIISPKNKSEYYLEKGDTTGITFSAKTQSDANKIYWFVNDKFIQKTNNAEIRNWMPQESGNYKITCTDNKGRNTEIKIKVNIY